jgi:hypothetical protein
LNVKTVLCYGFPLLLLIKSARDIIDHIISSVLTSLTAQERTLVSGTYRPYESRFPLLVSILNRIIVPIVTLTQKCFLRSDLGDGYIVLAEKQH